MIFNERCKMSNVIEADKKYIVLIQKLKKGVLSINEKETRTNKNKRRMESN